NRVIVTHPDGDHAGGLRSVLEEFKVEQLWMLRPWLYSQEIIGRFKRFTSVDNLSKRLRELYPNIVALEEIAVRKGIPIFEPFQGEQLGKFVVLAPTKERYLDLIVESDKTPEHHEEKEDVFEALFSAIGGGLRALAKAVWGEENFSDNPTSAENEMSVIQYANLCGHRILLTGDAGRNAMNEAADYAPIVGLNLPGLDRFQVPHHGSRRNVSSEVLDRWLGEKPFFKPAESESKFTAIVSASKKDEHHPRKAVVRGIMHRYGKVLSTEDGGIRTSRNAPKREGWIAASPLTYPDDQET
ncbi:MAG TPA: competence protein ComEC, partial [Rheinheimera sp.]|nr:competence protein ComEC [Rheinheimera sp.]